MSFIIAGVFTSNYGRGEGCACFLLPKFSNFQRIQIITEEAAGSASLNDHHSDWTEKAVLIQSEPFPLTLMFPTNNAN